MLKLVTTLLLLGAMFTAARADVVAIGWDDAPSRGGAVDRAFDCNTNTGSNTFVVTFSPPVDILGVTELKVSVNVTTGVGGHWIEPTYPGRLVPWWDLRPGTPRSGALTASADFLSEPWASSTTVEAPWTGGACAAVPYRVETTYHYSSYYPTDTSEVGVQDFDVAPPLGVSADLLAGHEYYIVRGTIRNAHTSGDGASSGCCQTAWLAASISVSAPGFSASFPFAWSAQSFTWNGSRNGSCSAAVPVRGSTWGALKSRYR